MTQRTEKELLKRLESLLSLYEERNGKPEEEMWPIKAYILGFGWCLIPNKETHLGRIHELCELLGLQKQDLYDMSLNYKNLSGDIEKIKGEL